MLQRLKPAPVWAPHPAEDRALDIQSWVVVAAVVAAVLVHQNGGKSKNEGCVRRYLVCRELEPMSRESDQRASGKTRQLRERTKQA